MFQSLTESKPTKRFMWLLCFMTIAGCGKSQDKPSIGLHISSPLEVIAHPDGQHFLVLNANLGKQFASGSVLTVDKQGHKISSMETPPLARSMHLAGSDLWVSFEGEDSHPLTSQLHLYDASNPKALLWKHTWELPECVPLSVQARAGYPYFALMCTSGALYVGELKTPRESTTLQKVRTYPGPTRKALYIHPERNLLFAFSTKLDAPGFTHDQRHTDIETRDENGQLLYARQEDDMPDFIGSQKRNLKDLKSFSHEFQYVVLDLKALAADDFAYQSYANIAFKELKWMYFDLVNMDGSPDEEKDTPLFEEHKNTKHYRTNFWHALHDPVDQDTFYLSHRGDPKTGGRFANNLIRIKIIDTPSAATRTKDFLTFERVFGFKGEQSDMNNYFGHFTVGSFQGQKIALLSSFRDMIHFSSTKYALYTTSLDSPYWWGAVTSSSNKAAYFQAALQAEGVVLASAYYSNTLVLFRMNTSGALEKETVIR